ncbi:bromodomain-containing protein [Cryptosporidium andersoni]|uniref:Bromodomain-containing protein n=1 Tax=Cryptosporidium andersoni TaxID=117008 RepID=A0A1J4MEQ3_9CRYT|nr:bromodomain-containing protein [Cryptosporidium andersoni]
MSSDILEQPITRTIKRKLLVCLDNLRKQPYFKPFKDPIDPVKNQCPDYFEVIKKPIDLHTIVSKLNKDTYRTLLEFYEDVMLIFSNCRCYNTAPYCSPLLEYCYLAERKFRDEWSKLGFSNSGEFLDVTVDDTSALDESSSIVSFTSNKRIKIAKNSYRPSGDVFSNTNRREEVNNKQRAAKSDAHTENSDISRQSTKKPRNNHTKNCTEDWRIECMKILDLMRKDSSSFLFENPVLESTELNDETKSKYREVVTECMDYKTIEARLLNNVKRRQKKPISNKETINSPEEFEKLVRLVYMNCMTFNPPTGECKWIYDAGKNSMQKFLSLCNRSPLFNKNISNCNEKLNNSYKLGSEDITIKEPHKCGGALRVVSVRTKISSITKNKIISKWNKFSMEWRQKILTQNKDRKFCNNENLNNIDDITTVIENCKSDMDRINFSINNLKLMNNTKECSITCDIFSEDYMSIYADDINGNMSANIKFIATKPNEQSTISAGKCLRKGSYYYTSTTIYIPVLYMGNVKSDWQKAIIIEDLLLNSNLPVNYGTCIFYSTQISDINDVSSQCVNQINLVAISLDKEIEYFIELDLFIKSDSEIFPEIYIDYSDKINFDILNVLKKVKINFNIGNNSNINFKVHLSSKKHDFLPLKYLISLYEKILL